MKPEAPLVPSNPGVETDRETEATLLDRCKSGDTRAFQSLVETHQDRAYALALRIVRVESDAEEIAQDAFVKAWLAIREFRGDSSFATWLHRIVLRRALDRADALRARGRREERLEPEPDTSGAPIAVTLPEAESPDTRRLTRLMDSLTPIQRATLALHYYEDRSVTEIAAMLDLPEGTVKTHMSRGRAALREAWAMTDRTEWKP